MKDKKTNNSLEEVMNKKIMKLLYLVYIVSFVSYIAIIALASYFLSEGTELGIIIVVSTIAVLAISFYAFKFEVETGYYECSNCHHKFVPSYFEALMAMHVVTIRHLKCPNCSNRSWAKKVMNK